jgi:hypothetical protein
MGHEEANPQEVVIRQSGRQVSSRHMTPGEIVAIVVGAITVIGAIVSLVRYLRAR